jgi:hypothetical protein
MAKGTALFDTVAISGTEARVRAGLVRRCAVWAVVGGRGATADCSGLGCAGLCAGLRRRGEHGGWGRHVQGRLDREQHGGACAERESRVPRRGMVFARRGTADGWRARCGARMLHTVRALHDAPALVTHSVARFPNGRMHALRAARCRQGACGTGCAGALCDVHIAPACVACCIGARCIGAIHRLVCCINMSHRCVLHRCTGAPCCTRCALYVASARVACCMLRLHALQVASLRVASAPVALARVASAHCIDLGCLGSRCIGLCCIGLCCIGAA